MRVKTAVNVVQCSRSRYVTTGHTKLLTIIASTTIPLALSYFQHLISTKYFHLLVFKCVLFTVKVIKRQTKTINTEDCERNHPGQLQLYNLSNNLPIRAGESRNSPTETAKPTSEYITKTYDYEAKVWTVTQDIRFATCLLIDRIQP